MTVDDAVFWSRGERHDVRALDRDLDVDAVVVGGGIAGLTACATLADLGLRVVLLEQEYCGAGATGRSSGFLTPDAELQLTDLRKKFGDTRARCLWELAAGGIDIIRASVATNGIACDLEPHDSLFVAERPAHEARCVAEHESRIALGYESRLLRGAALTAQLDGNFFAGVGYGGTASLDAYRYARGLRRSLVDRGVSVYEGTRVSEARRERVIAGAHSVRAKHVVLCTDRFLPYPGALARSVGQVQTFLAISEPLPDAVLHRLFPAGPRLVWEARLVYHYARVVPGGRLLVGGSSLVHTYANRATHDPAATTERLGRWVAKFWSGVEIPWAAAWPGMLGVTRDFLALAGELPDLPGVHCVVAGTGLPWCAALGRAVAESIVSGRDSVPPELSAARAMERGWTHVLLNKPLSFALAHAREKLVG
jgi:gamma-glutamylputrescine oxidase